MPMHKPSYSTSKRALWLSSIMAWIVILILAVGAAMGGKAVEFGSIAVPSMVALIAALLGIHRFTGSLDFRASQPQAAEAPASPPFSARDDPTSGDAP